MVYSQLATTNPPPTGPIILWQPGNETVSVGQTAVFTVVADSSVPLNYQWVFDGTNTLAGATNSSLSLGDVQPSEAGTYEVWVFNAAGSAHSMAAKLTVTPIALPGYITAVLRSECTDSPPPPRLVGEVATGPDYVIITVGLGDPGNWQNAQQLASDAVFESIMPLYCALPKVGCVTDSVQWNIITYDANGNPNTSGCAASGCQDHSCAGFESGSQVTNGYITAVLRSDCTSEPAPPAPVGATSFGPDYVIKTVADANPANLQYARQILTDAIFESLMPVYCALPENSGVGCVTNRVQWNIITYDTNGNPLISGCPTSGCGYHYCGKGPTVTTGPALTIASSINKLGLCWPSDATDFILEASSNLVNWYAVDSAVATNGGQMSAQVPAPAQGLFYRLHHK
jgi:hypothetical protein